VANFYLAITSVTLPANGYLFAALSERNHRMVLIMEKMSELISFTYVL